MLQQMVQGGLAGLVATAPMTAAMRAGERLVPLTSKGRLPPRQITERVLHKVGLKHELDEDDRSLAATLAHYGFGTAAGSLLGLAASQLRTAPRPLLGAALGVGVWAASYAGWLPTMGIRRSATEEPAGRNLQMIAAHLVWGAAAGAVFDAMLRADG